jgi:hypothetical protein
VDVDLVLADEVQQEVERTMERRQRDLVRIRLVLLGTRRRRFLFVAHRTNSG